MKKLLPSFILLAACSAQVLAQTPYSINNDLNRSSGGDNNGMGSSFLTVGAGYLDSIDVIIRSGTNTSATVYVYEGNTNDAGALLHQETVSGIPTGTEAYYRIHFANSVAVDAASTYTFMVYDVPLRFGYGDNYADGSMWTGQGFLTAGEHTNADVDFVAYIGAQVITANADATDGEAHFLFADHTISTKNFAADEILVHDLQGQQIAGGKGQSLVLSEATKEGLYIVSVRKDTQMYKAKIFVKAN
ncbi:MAG: hypothetical protein JWO58_622 [Chitinophagaceae bacterium]|nr:hypothetical protein [Chitinophagaceae bacterium]